MEVHFEVQFEVLCGVHFAHPLAHVFDHAHVGVGAHLETCAHAWTFFLALGLAHFGLGLDLAHGLGPAHGFGFAQIPLDRKCLS